MHAPYTHSQHIHYLDHHANATGSGTDLEHVQCDDLQSLGMICHALQVGVGGEHYLEYVQEELQRVSTGRGSGPTGGGARGVAK